MAAAPRRVRSKRIPHTDTVAERNGHPPVIITKQVEVGAIEFGEGTKLVDADGNERPLGLFEAAFLVVGRDDADEGTYQWTDPEGFAYEVSVNRTDLRHQEAESDEVAQVIARMAATGASVQEAMFSLQSENKINPRSKNELARSVSDKLSAS